MAYKYLKSFTDFPEDLISLLCEYIPTVDEDVLRHCIFVPVLCQIKQYGIQLWCMKYQNRIRFSHTKRDLITYSNCKKHLDKREFKNLFSLMDFVITHESPSQARKFFKCLEQDLFKCILFKKPDHSILLGIIPSPGEINHPHMCRVVEQLSG